MQTSLQSSGNADLSARSLAAPSLFAAFPEALRSRLLAAAVPRNFASGQIIQQRGDAANGFWIIEQGQVKIGRFGEGGRFQMVALMAAGDSYGELAMFSKSARVVDAVSLGESRLLWVARQDVENLIDTDPAIGRELVRILSAQLQEVLDMLIMSRRLPAINLLARSLFSLCRGRGDRTVDLTQEDLAELVGVSRVTISKALGKLEQGGAIETRYGKIAIRNAEILRRY